MRYIIHKVYFISYNVLFVSDIFEKKKKLIDGYIIRVNSLHLPKIINVKTLKI